MVFGAAGEAGTTRVWRSREGARERVAPESRGARARGGAPWRFVHHGRRRRCPAAGQPCYEGAELSPLSCNARLHARELHAAVLPLALPGLPACHHGFIQTAHARRASERHERAKIRGGPNGLRHVARALSAADVPCLPLRAFITRRKDAFANKVAISLLARVHLFSTTLFSSRCGAACVTCAAAVICTWAFS